MLTRLNTARHLSWSQARRDLRADRVTDKATLDAAKAARRAAELAALRARRELIAANEAEIAARVGGQA